MIVKATSISRSVDFGPGWRMDYVQRGSTIIVMLGGGDKSSQQADIRTAIALANSLED